jgi:hypothetical protein
MKSMIYNIFKILLSEYLREYVAKNLKKRYFPPHFHSVFHSVVFWVSRPQSIGFGSQPTQSPSPLKAPETAGEANVNANVNTPGETIKKGRAPLEALPV